MEATIRILAVVNIAVIAVLLRIMVEDWNYGVYLVLSGFVLFGLVALYALTAKRKPMVVSQKKAMQLRKLYSQESERRQRWSVRLMVGGLAMVFVTANMGIAVLGLLGLALFIWGAAYFSRQSCPFCGGFTSPKSAECYWCGESLYISQDET